MDAISFKPTAWNLKHEHSEKPATPGEDSEGRI